MRMTQNHGVRGSLFSIVHKNMTCGCFITRFVTICSIRVRDTPSYFSDQFWRLLEVAFGLDLAIRHDTTMSVIPLKDKSSVVQNPARFI